MLGVINRLDSLRYRSLEPYFTKVFATLFTFDFCVLMMTANVPVYGRDNTICLTGVPRFVALTGSHAPFPLDCPSL